MKRFVFISALTAAFIMPLSMQAQSHYSEGNTGNAVVLRDPARQSSTDIDAVIFNPAGTAWLKDGFHLSVNGIASWKSINSRVVGYDKKYDVKQLDITPSIQLAYKRGDWTFSASFASEGGLGKLKGEYGTGPSEAMFGKLTETINTQLQDLATSYELAYRLGVIPELNIHSNDELRLNSSDYKVWLNNWVTRIGASYKFNDWFSGYVGVKLNKIHYSSEYNLSTEIVRPSTNSTFQPESYFNDAIDKLNASSMQNEFTQGIEELLTTSKEICSLYDEIGYQTGSLISVNQWGLSPIIGLDAHFNKFNFGIKYEFQSIMLTDTEEGFNSFKTPAELSVGASWQATNWLKVAAGSNIYFKTSKQGFRNLSETNSYSLSGSLTFNLPKNWILSGGYSFYNSTEIYDSLWKASLGANGIHNHLFSFGLGYAFNEHLQLNIGASIYTGSDIHTNVNVNYDNLNEEFSAFNTSFQMVHELSVKTTFGVGLNYSF